MSETDSNTTVEEPTPPARTATEETPPSPAPAGTREGVGFWGWLGRIVSILLILIALVIGIFWTLNTFGGKKDDQTRAAEAAAQVEEAEHNEEIELLKKQLADMKAEMEAKEAEAQAEAEKVKEEARKNVTLGGEPLEPINQYPPDINGRTPEVAMSDFTAVGGNPRVGFEYATDLRTGKILPIAKDDASAKWERSSSDPNVLFPFHPKGEIRYIDTNGYKTAEGGMLKVSRDSDPAFHPADGYTLIKISEKTLRLLPESLRPAVQEGVLGVSGASVYCQVPTPLASVYDAGGSPYLDQGSLRIERQTSAVQATRIPAPPVPGPE